MLTFVAPSPSVDVTYVVDKFVLGEAHRPVSVHRNAGGKSLNAARAAATMGADVKAITVLSGQSGGFVTENLREDGVELLAIHGSHDTRSCISIASRVDRSLTELYEHASLVSGDEWDGVVATLQNVLPLRPSWVAASGSVPGSLDDSALAQLIDSCQRSRVPFAVDSHGIALSKAVGAKPALVKVNRVEAAQLLGSPGRREVSELAAAVQTLSDGVVIVTDGTEGAVATDGIRYWQVPPPERLGAFPVGSGDSFLGGLLSAMDAGLDFANALKRGAGCAVANALEPGAGTFERDTALEITSDIELVIW